MYIELTNATANIGVVCEAIRRQWGSTYTVASTEGLEIDDTNAIQGRCSCSAPCDVISTDFMHVLWL